MTLRNLWNGFGMGCGAGLGLLAFAVLLLIGIFAAFAVWVTSPR